MVFAATCDQPPGAAQRSRVILDFCRKEYFLLIWMSLKAARER
jgi:hypothetical protein